MITLLYLKKALKYLWNYFSKNISSSVESDSLFISEKNEAITIFFNLIKLNQSSRDSSMAVSDLAFSSVKSPTRSVKGSGAGLGDDICPLVSWTQSRDWASISDNTSGCLKLVSVSQYCCLYMSGKRKLPYFLKLFVCYP